jgi:hypothetical protein
MRATNDVEKIYVYKKDNHVDLGRKDTSLSEIWFPIYLCINEKRAISSSWAD